MSKLLLEADSYKYSHAQQYPEGTTYLRAYISPRHYDRDFWPTEPEVVHLGLSAFALEYLKEPVKASDIYDMVRVVKEHMGLELQTNMFMEMFEDNGGRWPLTIEAPPEGTVLPVGNAQVQLINSDPRYPWLTTFIETALLRAIWYPSTVATLSREAKKIIYASLQKTSDDPDGQIPFKLHDFGARGATSRESAQLGGMAHLVNFMGTDTITALPFIHRIYGEPMAGFSIPASEHSTIMSWGEKGEVDAFRNLINQFGHMPMYACVSDTYNWDRAVADHWGDELAHRVLQANGTLVIRPDSGDAVENLLYGFKIIDERIGGTTTNKRGYKVLHPKVRFIQGDGVSLREIRDILGELNDAKWSTDNVAFGMGAGLLQKINRDTLGYAMKANEVQVNGEWRDIYKRSRGKASFAGELGLVRRPDGSICTYEKNGFPYQGDTLWEKVVEKGMVKKVPTFADIRERAMI